MYIFKVCLTFFIFFWFHFRLASRYNQIKKKPQLVNEESNYLWAKKYSRYLLWLYGYKVITPNLESWKFKPVVILIDKFNFISPLLLIKFNDFNKNPPVLFVLTQTFLQSLPKTLFKFYALVNTIVLKDRAKNFSLERATKQAVEKIQIPRSVCLFLQDLENPKLSKLLTIAQGGFVSILLAKISFQGKKISLKSEQLFAAKEVVKTNYKSLLFRLKQSTT